MAFLNMLQAAPQPRFMPLGYEVARGKGGRVAARAKREEKRAAELRTCAAAKRMALAPSGAGTA